MFDLEPERFQNPNICIQTSVFWYNGPGRLIQRLVAVFPCIMNHLAVTYPQRRARPAETLGITATFLRKIPFVYARAGEQRWQSAVIQRIVAQPEWREKFERAFTVIRSFAAEDAGRFPELFLQFDKLSADLKYATGQQDAKAALQSALEQDLARGILRLDLAPFAPSRCHSEQLDHFPSLKHFYANGWMDYQRAHPSTHSLKLHRIDCRDLIQADSSLFGGLSDPYVKISLRDCLNTRWAPPPWKSPHLSKTLNATWYSSSTELDDSLDAFVKCSAVEMPSLADVTNNSSIEMSVELWDHDTFSKDDFLGSCAIRLFVIFLAAHLLDRSSIVIVLKPGSNEHGSVPTNISSTIKLHFLVHSG